MTNEEIKEYSNLIYAVAHSFTWYPDKEDLFQAGYKGLMMASTNFDVSKGVKFSTYAYPFIWGEMNKWVVEDKNIKVGRNHRKLKLQIERARVLLEQQLLREPSTLELAYYLNVSEEELTEAMRLTSTISLDSVISDDGKELTLYDTVPSKGMDIATLTAFKEELNNLTSFEKSIIEARYLNDMSQQEVANVFGMSQVQVSREEKKIKEKIKMNMAA